MAGYVFIGRKRDPIRLWIYQILTVGIYGRALLYKWLREFDGHEALFLDRRPYLFLLILPFIGPLLVKRRIAILLEDVVHHDVTSPHYRRAPFLALAVVPLLPFYHWRVQTFLNRHWSMHGKEAELDLRRAQLEALRRSRSAESVQRAKELEREVASRAKELDDLKQAAIALHEAEQIRRQAEREMGRAGPIARVRKLIPSAALKFPRRRAPTPEVEELPEEEEEPPRPSKPPKVETPIEEEAPPPPKPPKKGKAAAEAPAEASAPQKGWRSFLPFKGPKEGPSPEERRELRRRTKEEKKAAKLAQKEERRKQKEAAKEAKRLEKESRREAKAKEKSRKKEKTAQGSAAKKKPGAKKAPRSKGRSR